MYIFVLKKTQRDRSQSRPIALPLAPTMSTQVKVINSDTCPGCEVAKQLQTMMVPPPCFAVGVSFYLLLSKRLSAQI